MGLAISQRIPVNTWLFSLAIVTAALGFIVIADVPKLLPLESLGASSSLFNLSMSLIPLIASMSYLGLFILMFLENMALPIPSEVVLPMAGYMILIGKMNFALTLTTSTAASLLGSLAIYYLATKLSTPVVYRFSKKIGVSSEKLVKLERWLSGNHGSALILFARFAPGIRSSISIPAGLLRMNLIRFSLMTLIGSFGWSLLLIYIGYTSSSLISTVSNVLLLAAPYAMISVSTAYIFYYAIVTNRRKKLRIIN